MPPISTFSPRLRALWSRFLTTHAGMALLYGFFGAYSMLYLAVQLRSVGMKGTILEQLLPVFAVSMLLDAVLGPFAGNYADARGRQRAITYSLVFLALGLFCAIAIPFVRDVADAPFWVFYLGIGIQVLLRVSAAFYTTSLDAWWVDLLQEERFTTGQELQKFFARQAQVTGLFLVSGGAAALYYGPRLTGGLGFKEGISLEDPGCKVFGLGIVCCIWIWFFIRFGLETAGRRERRALSLSEELRWKVRMLWRSPEIPRAIGASSIVFICAAAFPYLIPLLMNDASIVKSGSTFHQWIGANYWVFYLTMGSTQLIGPVLAQLVRFNKTNTRKREFSLWSTLVCASLIATGLAYAYLSREMIDLALPLLILARVLTEAFKPVQAAYLNELVSLRSMRAFALSVSTAPGSFSLFAGACALMAHEAGVERALESWARPAHSVPIALVALGFTCWFLLKLALRPAKPRPSLSMVPPTYVSPLEVQAVLARAAEARQKLRVWGLIPEVKRAELRAGRRRIPQRPRLGAKLRASGASPSPGSSGLGSAISPGRTGTT